MIDLNYEILKPKHALCFYSEASHLFIVIVVHKRKQVFPRDDPCNRFIQGIHNDYVPQMVCPEQFHCLLNTGVARYLVWELYHVRPQVDPFVLVAFQSIQSLPSTWLC